MIYIQRLTIRNNKVLQDVTLDFEGLKSMTVLIGENGSGKTTILESITAIFAALHQSVEGLKVVAPAFDFELQYIIQTEGIHYEDEVGAFIQTTFTEVIVSGERNVAESLKTIVGNETERILTRDLLPNLVIYYPGSSDTLLNTYQHFTDDQEKRLRSKAKSSIEAYTRIKDLPVFYYQKQHFDILLAALLSFEYSDDIEKFFLEKLQIELFGSSPIRLFLKKNQFRKGFGANEFWGADGEVRQFLDFLRVFASREIKDEQGDRISFSFTIDGWYELREQYIDEKALFLMLNTLETSDLLAGFDIAFRRNSNIFPHFFLSEGERQLIITKGLAELLFDENTLFLLDEPNVFMHTNWQSNFIEDLNQYIKLANFFITTHSPIILSNIKDGHLFRMTTGKAESITGHFYGREYSQNLEDLMGTPSRIIPISIKLKDLFDLIDEERFDEADIELNKLREMLGEDDADIVRAQTMLNFFR